MRGPSLPCPAYWVSALSGYIGMMPPVGQYPLVCCIENLMFHRLNRCYKKLSGEGHFLPEMRDLFIITSTAAMIGAAMTGNNPEGVVAVGAGVGTGASAADIRAL
jgi:hypothetical protein